MKATATIIAFIVGLLGVSTSPGTPGQRGVWIRVLPSGAQLSGEGPSPPVLHRRHWTGRCSASGWEGGALLESQLWPVVPAARGRDPLTRGLLPPALTVLLSAGAPLPLPLPLHPSPHPRPRAAQQNRFPSFRRENTGSPAAQHGHLGAFCKHRLPVLGKTVFKKLPW